MESFDELLHRAELAHGHMCPGQILGVRMALLGLKRLGVEDPRGTDRKRLVTYIEIDRCATDAIGMVTGCRLGKRSLKFRDWGKMAATFVDLTSGRGVRIVALEDSRELAQKLYPHIESKSAQQMAAYRALEDEQLFREQSVQVVVDARELPGSKGERLICTRCGEGVNFGRFKEVDGEKLCLSCARPELCYWTPLE
jgi:formylmethanofuran dehydrogenase subunit E